MPADDIDLPSDIKKNVIEELVSLNYVLDENKPIGKIFFGFVYRIRNITTNNLGVCKIIVVPSYFSKIMKEKLMKLVQKEVIFGYSI